MFEEYLSYLASINSEDFGDMDDIKLSEHNDDYDETSDSDSSPC